MNRKAVLTPNLIYILITLVFVAGLAIFLYSQQNGATFWSDYYTKELTRVINLSPRGSEITLDIHKATEIARQNGLPSSSEIFQFNNPENEVCVKLTKGKQTCYKYFNDVDIINPKIKLGKLDPPINVLTFQISEPLIENE